ncbi:MAG: RNA repair transcriptional activator RtcR, partial [Myxococcota bacterium]
MSDKDTVVIGFVGPQLDGGRGPERWQEWRPTVSLAQQPDLLVDRFELIYERNDIELIEVISEDIAAVSPDSEVRTHAVSFEDPWDFEEVFAELYDVSRSMPFFLEEEEYLLHITTGAHVQQLCLFLLAESRHFPASLLQTSPPRESDFVSGGRWRRIDLDLSTYDAIAARLDADQHEAQALFKSGIETRNDAFNALIERIERVAGTSEAPILLTGPTGSGKTSLARRIYELKKARQTLAGELVEVNCATLGGDTAMSTLFGQRKGANEAHPGLLAEVDGGVLLLDNIADLDTDAQAMLLHTLESGTYRPVGADREVSSHFQLIAGTNRDLDVAVREGEFREDLLARIDLWSFRLPSLSERREDIEPNIEHELRRFTRETGRVVSFQRTARDRYLEFARSPKATWRGNFRDLNASVTRMATLAASGRIDTDIVDDEIARLRRAWGERETATDDKEAYLRELLGDEAFHNLDRFDRVQLADVVHVCRECDTL